MTRSTPTREPSFPRGEEARAQFLRDFPAYRSTGRLDELRRTDYARLDEQGHVYLDYTGGGLYATSQLHDHLALLQNQVFGNPHSHNPTSQAMTDLVERTRQAVLAFFRAPKDAYAVVFTPNASGALKLVGEAYPFTAGSRFVLSADDHNSVNGIREYALARGAEVAYAAVVPPALRFDQAALLALLDKADPERPNLFAFPAQSNYSGVKHPLAMIALAQERGWDVLLDAAAFAPTNALDLGRWLPEFVTLSFYKMFGYPTGIGALLARRDALARLRRPWFAGGTVKIASTGAFSHFLADGEAAFEDGTVNYLGIPAIEIGLRHLEAIGMETIGERVRCLTGWLLDRLAELRHANGRPLVRVHGPADLADRGGTVTMSFFDPSGVPISGQHVELLAAAARISLRTGCFCNPGAGEATFRLPESLMRTFFEGTEGIHFVQLVEQIFHQTGVDVSGVRISLGLASNFDDVDRFLQFASGLRDTPAATLAASVEVPAAPTRDTP